MSDAVHAEGSGRRPAAPVRREASGWCSSLHWRGGLHEVIGVGRGAQRTMLSRTSAGALFTLSKAELEVKARALCVFPPWLQCVRGVSKEAKDVMLQGCSSGSAHLPQAGVWLGWGFEGGFRFGGRGYC